MNNEQAVSLARFMKAHLERNGIVEVRILHGLQAYIGYFDNYKDLVRAVVPVSSLPRTKIRFDDYPRSGEATGIYYTLNKVNTDLLARAHNRIIRSKVSTEDSDILAYTSLLIDADAVRPKGISSSDAEKSLAGCVIDQVITWFKDRGVASYKADSGNGYHAVVLLPHYPNSVETRDRVKRILQTMDKMFSTDSVKIDLSVYNASRISKLYGTMACKGDSIPDRPHRFSAIDWPADAAEFDVFALLGSYIDFTIATPAVVSAPSVTVLTDKLLSELLISVRDKVPAGDDGLHRLCYEDWRNMIFALQTTGRPHESLAAIMAATWPEMEPGEYLKKFGSTDDCADKEKGPITMGWLYDYARKLGVDINKYTTSIIPEDVIDLNAFFDGAMAQPLAVERDITSVNVPVQSDSTSVINSLIDPFYNRISFPEIEYLVPDAHMLPVKAVSSVAGEPGVGKSTFVTAGILIPMLRGEPILGQYKMAKTKTLYINSDNDGAYFMNRLVLPYGYDVERDRDTLLFVHTQNMDMNLSPSNIMLFIQNAINTYGYRLVVIDNRTSLFPKSMYGEKAQVESLILADGLKKVSIKKNISILLVEHVRKPMHKEWELLTLHDVLGSTSKVVEQTIGINARYDAQVSEGRPKKTTFSRRAGEGIIIPLKNAEGIEKVQYNIEQDVPYNYLRFEPYTTIYDETEGQSMVKIQSGDPCSAIRAYMLATDRMEFTFAELASELKIALSTVRYAIEQIAMESKIKIEGGKKGRGHKSVIKVLDRMSIITPKVEISTLDLPFEV